jgi:hypothetical protein
VRLSSERRSGGHLRCPLRTDGTQQARVGARYIPALKLHAGASSASSDGIAGLRGRTRRPTKGRPEQPQRPHALFRCNTTQSTSLGVAHVHCARVSVDPKRFTNCLGKTLSTCRERLAWRTRREHSPRRSDPSCRRSRVRDGSAASGAGSAVQPSAPACTGQPAVGDGICWCTPLICNESCPKTVVRRGTTLECRRPHAAHLGGSAAAYQCTHRVLLRSKSRN